MGYGYGFFTWLVIQGVLLVFASLIFSVVFWTTKHWLEGTAKKKRK